MARNTPIEKLNEAISSILNEYADNVGENVDRITEEIGKKGAQALRKESQEKLTAHTGKYAGGWKAKVDKGRLCTTATIYNDHYSLPHLLEHGHVSRNGTKRIFGQVPGYEHIKPVADDLIESFEREVLDKL